MFFSKVFDIIYIENKKRGNKKMKVWAVNIPDTFSKMTHTSLFIHKEDAEAIYNSFKDRGATISLVDDIARWF